MPTDTGDLILRHPVGERLQKVVLAPEVPVDARDSRFQLLGQCRHAELLEALRLHQLLRPIKDFLTAE
jgi:hypothetical protein